MDKNLPKGKRESKRGSVPNASTEKHLGFVDQISYDPKSINTDGVLRSDDSVTAPLETCQNLLEIEDEATKVLDERALTYFRSAADSCSSLKKNSKDWSRVTFRPRVLRDVVKAEMGRKIMGQRSTLPFFIAPMAMIKLANADGELAFARAAGSKGIPYVVSTYSSCSHEEIMALVRGQNLPGKQMFQLYVPRQRRDAEKLIQMARSLGFTALLITVDTPVVGKREEDDRYKARVNYRSGETDSPRTMDVQDPSQKPVLRGVHSSTLNWHDISWIRKAWGETGPIILKGIQSAEDAELAYNEGIDGIYLSNHGGRQLDFAPSSLQTLLEIRRFCPQIIGKIEIYLDGGVRRGTDIIKAICLGATAVGIGRPFVYALGAYGQQGVEKVIERKCRRSG